MDRDENELLEDSRVCSLERSLPRLAVVVESSSADLLRDTTGSRLKVDWHSFPHQQQPPIAEPHALGGRLLQSRSQCASLSAFRVR